jgi:hypothetical protein
MTFSEPVCNALLGLRRWDTPAVQQQAKWMLGITGTNKFDGYSAWLGAHRASVAAQVKENWKLVQKLELECFGKNSFFRQPLHI